MGALVGFNLRIDGCRNQPNPYDDTFTALWYEVTRFTDPKFGGPGVRGPEGPLNHLRKEIDEIFEDYNDPEEFADAFILLFDAAHLAFHDPTLIQEEIKLKMEKNRRRTWQQPDPVTGVIEHDRSKD